MITSPGCTPCKRNLEWRPIGLIDFGVLIGTEGAVIYKTPPDPTCTTPNPAPLRPLSGGASVFPKPNPLKNAPQNASGWQRGIVYRPDPFLALLSPYFDGFRALRKVSTPPKSGWKPFLTPKHPFQPLFSPLSRHQRAAPYRRPEKNPLFYLPVYHAYDTMCGV